MEYPSSYETNVDMMLEFKSIDRSKSDMINNCTSEPAFYLKVFNYEYVNGVGWYRVERGVMNNGLNQIHVTRHNVRYSMLYKLYNAVKDDFFTSCINYEFPPKTWFKVTDPKVLDYRAKKFDEFFQYLIKIPNVNKLNQYIEIFGTNTTLSR